MKKRRKKKNSTLMELVRRRRTLVRASETEMCVVRAERVEL